MNLYRRGQIYENHCCWNYFKMFVTLSRSFTSFKSDWIVNFGSNLMDWLLLHTRHKLKSFSRISLITMNEQHTSNGLWLYILENQIDRWAIARMMTRRYLVSMLSMRKRHVNSSIPICLWDVRTLYTLAAGKLVINHVSLNFFQIDCSMNIYLHEISIQYNIKSAP